MAEFASKGVAQPVYSSFGECYFYPKRCRHPVQLHYGTVR